MSRDIILECAQELALRSDCRRRKVGAVVTNTSYSGVYTFGYILSDRDGRGGCLEDVCPRGLLSTEECPPYAPYGNCISEHAEIVALKNWRRSGRLMRNTAPRMVVTHRPCEDCTAVLSSGAGMFTEWFEDGVWHNLDSTREENAR